MTGLTRRVAGKNIYSESDPSSSSLYSLRVRLGSAPRKSSSWEKTPSSSGGNISTSRPDISILKAHKAPLEGDAQMTNRSANNKSRRRHSTWDFGGSTTEAKPRSRIVFARNAGRRNIEYSSRSPRFRQPAKSERSGRNISSGIMEF